MKKTLQISGRKVLNQIRGCLFGGAAGDALGYPVEFLKTEDIFHRYGPDGIREYELDGGLARISDDTQMTLFTCEGLILGGIGENDEYDPTENIYQSYLCWLQTQGYQSKSKWDGESELLRNPLMRAWRAPGNTCLASLDSGKMGTPEQPINNSKGCGGVMRAAPLGMLPVSRKRAMQFGGKVAAITHGHPMSTMASAMHAGIIHGLLYSRYSSLYYVVERALNETLSVYCEYTEDAPAFEELMRRAIQLSQTEQDDVKAIHSLGGGWIGEEALAIAVYCALKYSRNFSAAMIAAVNHDGDADSTGAIAGNILGAYLGYDAIEERWLRDLELTDEIEKIARKTFALVKAWCQK